MWLLDLIVTLARQTPRLCDQVLRQVVFTLVAFSLVWVDFRFPGLPVHSQGRQQDQLQGLDKLLPLGPKQLRWVQV